MESGPSPDALLPEPVVPMLEPVEFVQELSALPTKRALVPVIAASTSGASAGRAAPVHESMAATRRFVYSTRAMATPGGTDSERPNSVTRRYGGNDGAAPETDIIAGFVAAVAGVDAAIADIIGVGEGDDGVGDGVAAASKRRGIRVRKRAA